jgi:prepilin-type N-terminal cleavage/methylation domain-containing protein
MKLDSVKAGGRASRGAFTLVELMVAMSVGVILAGTVVLLLVQAGTEEQRGYADSTVEERAYILQADITSCLRGMSSGYGITGSSTNQIANTNGVAWYTKIYVFHPDVTGANFTTAMINADLATGAVVYTPNIAVPGTTIVWMTNSPSVKLGQFYFATYPNLDGTTLNSSLVYVTFQMDDNGYSRQNVNDNIANIKRSFSVQMRCD